MFKFEPIILRQTKSEIDLRWNDFEDCDVYKIEHNSMGLEGELVYWGKNPKCQISSLQDNFCYKFKIYALKLQDGQYNVMCASDIFKANTLPNIPTTISFYRAIRKSQDYLVKRYILSSIHMIDVPGPNLLTPLANAVLVGNKDIVELIINAKADVNLGCPIINRTPLHIAMFYGYVTIGKLLIDHKADTTKEDCIGLNFIHYAINGGNFNAIRFAVDNSEDGILNKENRFGWNLMVSAVFMRCHVKIIKILIGYESRLKTTDQQKDEALQLAEITEQTETFAFLESVFRKTD